MTINELSQFLKIDQSILSGWASLKIIPACGDNESQRFDLEKVLECLKSSLATGAQEQLLGYLLAFGIENESRKLLLEKIFMFAKQNRKPFIKTLDFRYRNPDTFKEVHKLNSFIKDFIYYEYWRYTLDAEDYTMLKKQELLGEYYSIVEEIGKKGADRGVINRILLLEARVLNFLNHLMYAEKTVDALKKITLSSLKHHKLLFCLLEKNNTLSTNLKKQLITENAEIGEFLKLTKSVLDDNRIQKVRDSIGLNYCKGGKLEKTRIFKFWIIELEEHLRPYYHFSRCEKNCRVTHEHLLADIARLVKTSIPGWWEDITVKQLANRVKQVIDKKEVFLKKNKYILNPDLS